MVFSLTRILLYLSQILALFFGIKNRAKIKDSNQEYFLYFMVYVLVHELACLIFAYYTLIGNNFVINIYIIISFIFYFYWFNKVLKNKRIYIVVALILFVISVMYSFSLGTFYTKIWFHPMLIGTISILMFVCLIFSEMLNSKEVVNFKQSQKFWFAIGLLIFYLGYLPILFFQDYIQSHSINYSLVLTILNIFLYGCFSKGFKCQIKN